MHVANIRPTKKWTRLEDLITSAIGELATLREGVVYEIHNNGGDTAYVISQATEPSSKSGQGYALLPLCTYGYKSGINTCYVRCGGSCSLHIEEAE